MHWTGFAVKGSGLLLVMGLALAGATTVTAQQENPRIWNWLATTTSRAAARINL
jgi:hypothetical protein